MNAVNSTIRLPRCSNQRLATYNVPYIINGTIRFPRGTIQTLGHLQCVRHRKLYWQTPQDLHLDVQPPIMQHTNILNGKLYNVMLIIENFYLHVNMLFQWQKK